MAAAKKKPEAGKRLDLTFLSFVLILLTSPVVSNIKTKDKKA